MTPRADGAAPHTSTRERIDSGAAWSTQEPPSAEKLARADAIPLAAASGSRGSPVTNASPRPEPPFVRERVPVWGTPPPALALMKSVKQRLDPGGCLAPGRFVGGI